MIHQHYEPQQILWFLRNFWKFTREKLIEEWHRVFQDPNFGKSQYQWLKSRYGMKAEWGAALNHPPYPGARPGGSGTEFWEPPEVPDHPPRMTLRTRSDSPAPSLVTAPAGPVNELPASQSGGAGRGRCASAGMNQKFVGNFQNTSPASQTSMTTPVTPHRASTSSMYNVNNTRSASGSMNGVNGSNGTYSIPLAMDLSSPFRSVGQGGVGDMTMHPYMAFSMGGAGAAAPSSIGTMNQFQTASGMAGGQSMASQNMNPQQPLASGLASFQFAQNPSFQHLGGDYGYVNSAQNLYSSDNSLASLGISSGNPFFMPSTVANPSPAHFIPTTMAYPSSLSNVSGRSNTGSSPNNADIIANVFGASGSVNRDLMETVVSPSEKPKPVDLTGKRKYMTVEVECEPRKRLFLDPALQDFGNADSIVAAQFPTGSPPAQAGGVKAPKSHRKKTGPSSRTPSPRTSSPRTGVPVTPRRQTVVSPSSSSPASDMLSPDGAGGDWFLGTHGGCSIAGRHRHDSSGGIYFSQSYDYVTSTNMGSACKVTASTPSQATNTVATPALTPQASATPGPALAATAVPASMEMPAVKSEKTSTETFSPISPDDTKKPEATDTPGAAATSTDGNKDGVTDASDLEYRLMTQLRASLSEMDAANCTAISTGLQQPAPSATATPPDVPTTSAAEAIKGTLAAQTLSTHAAVVMPIPVDTADTAMLASFASDGSNAVDWSYPTSQTGLGIAAFGAGDLAGSVVGVSSCQSSSGLSATMSSQDVQDTFDVPIHSMWNFEF